MTSIRHQISLQITSGISVDMTRYRTLRIAKSSNETFFPCTLFFPRMDHDRCRKAAGEVIVQLVPDTARRVVPRSSPQRSAMSFFLFYMFILGGFQSCTSSVDNIVDPAARTHDELLLLASDIYFNPKTRLALDSLRKSNEALSEGGPLSTAAAENFVTLTLTGYKGEGRVDQQINQDRGFIWRSKPNSGDFLMGVLDGHGDLGHDVSEFCQYEIIRRVKEKIFMDPPALSETLLDDDTVAQILADTFELVDHSIPEEIAQEGGTTASVVLHYNSRLFFANSGDSQSVLAALWKDSVVVLHETRLHKPDDELERNRILDAGGKVADEGENDPYHWVEYQLDGITYYLAMTRSLGDRGATHVISTPEVHVLDIMEAQTRAIAAFTTSKCQDEPTTGTCEQVSSSEILLFVVSASDGVIDYIDGQQLANFLSTGLRTDKSTMILSVESLVSRASGLWRNDYGGRKYRWISSPSNVLLF